MQNILHRKQIKTIKLILIDFFLIPYKIITIRKPNKQNR